MKHTPGPWKFTGGTLILDKSGYNVAQVNIFTRKDEEAKANAHIIAAAPELLEALKRLAEYGDVFRYRIGERNPYEQAVEAIKKAEGK